MFKSFVLGLYASGHSLHVRVTQTFAVNRFRTGAIYSMHSKTMHRLSFLKDGAKVQLNFDVMTNMRSPFLRFLVRSCSFLYFLIENLVVSYDIITRV